jgi:4-hydroxy-tetrahydrodipicolinate reductase
MAVDTKVAVLGATGWVGRALCPAVADTGDLELVAAMSRTNAGRNLGGLIARPDLGITIAGTVGAVLAAQPDVVVDYTSATAVKGNVLAALNVGVNVVIGSSGLTEADFTEIDSLARERNVGVIAAGNFAITAVLLQRFAAEAAKYLDQWEIIDYSSDLKIDAPSGTARELAHRLGQVQKPQPTHPVEAIVGERDSRGANIEGTQIHSIRVPGFVLGAEVIFGAPDERLSIRHDAGGGPEPYIAGTLLAIRKVKGRVGLTRGLEELLDSK